MVEKIKRKWPYNQYLLDGEKVEVGRQVMRLIEKCRGSGSRAAVPGRQKEGLSPALPPHTPAQALRSSLYSSGALRQQAWQHCALGLTGWPADQSHSTNEDGPHLWSIALLTEREATHACKADLRTPQSLSHSDRGPSAAAFHLPGIAGVRDLTSYMTRERGQSHGLDMANSQRKRLE